MKNKFKGFALLLLLLSSCSFNSEQHFSSIDENIYVSKIIKSKNKNYLEVDGLPFIYNGIQIRTDWLINNQKETIEDIEYYFQVASELGVRCVEIPLRWMDLEPKEDAYDFRDVSKYMSYAKKYNLRIEFLLFGVNVGGMSGVAPDYIKKDKATYPQYENTLDHPDALFFVQTNENILNREKKCAEALMNAIYTWSKESNYNAVISIQVRNEPDLYLPKIEQYSLKKGNGEQLTFEEGYKEMISSIGSIASVIKEAKYKLITRVNTCCYSLHPELNQKLWNDILSLGNIDLIGEDTYNQELTFNKDIIIKMSKLNLKYSTIPQIAENTGHFGNNNSLFLMANMLGAGYNLYDMITPSVITDEWGYYDWGLLDNKTKKPKETFVNTKEVLEGINKAGPLFLATSSKDIACFNLESNWPKENLSQTINTTKTTYKFETNSKSIGYAINNNEYIYLFASGNSKVTISNSELESNYAEIGYLNPYGEFINSGDKKEIIKNSISIEKGNLYRIKTSSLGNLNSNTIDSIYTEVQYEN